MAPSENEFDTPDLMKTSLNSNSNLQNQKDIFNSSILFRIRYGHCSPEIKSLVRKIKVESDKESTYGKWHKMHFKSNLTLGGEHTMQ